MALLRVRYRTGDTDEWELHERMNADKTAVQLMRTWAQGGLFSFTTVTEVGSERVDYSRVILRTRELTMAQVDGLLDYSDLAVWQDPDLQGDG